MIRYILNDKDGEQSRVTLYNKLWVFHYYLEHFVHPEQKVQPPHEVKNKPPEPEINFGNTRTGNDCTNFHSCTVHLHIIKVFYLPTDAQ